MERKNNNNKNREKSFRLLLSTGVFLILIVAVLSTGIVFINAAETDEFFKNSKVNATNPVSTGVNVSVNYLNETIIVTKGNQNSSKLFFSQDKKKTWELIQDPNGLLDLTIFMKSSDNTLYFKGDKDKEIVELTIPKEDNSLKVKYYVENGIGKLQFTNAYGSMQYRKGANGAWKTYVTDLDLSDYEINGYTLQFRMMASVNKRAGKIVNVKIPKRQSAPNVKINYSKFVITGLKAGSTQYRLSTSNTWITFQPKDSSNKYLDLKALLLPKGTLQNASPIPAATIEFRTAPTDKKVASGIRAVDIEPQPISPDAVNIKLEGNTITFNDASRSKPYEYIALHAKEEFDLYTAKWKKVTSDKPIKIKKIGTASPVPGDVIYYRLASTTDKATKLITPASMYSFATITSIVLPEN